MTYDEPLTGDEIANRLYDAGLLPPSDPTALSENDLIDVLIAEAVTAPLLDLIVEMGGARLLDPVERGRGIFEASDDWRGLVNLLLTTTPDEIREWRSQTGLNDAFIWLFFDEVSMAAAKKFHDARLLDMTSIDEVKDRFEVRGVRWKEAERWLTSGLIDGFADEQANVVAKWVANLGPRAFFYAAAGMSLEDAKAMDAKGGYDEQGLATLAALRTPGNRLALVPA